MKSSVVYRYALSISAASALLSGCGASQPATTLPNVTSNALFHAGRRGTTASYGIAYEFNHTRQGGRPSGSLLDVNGILYGTTLYGGGGSCYIFGGGGCGTVYSLDPSSGKKKLLYRFHGGSTDGAYPNGALINVGGTLYGTTAYGGGGCGTQGCGTVYSVAPNGAEKMLHTFAHQGDGYTPIAGLVDVKGTLYGTASSGGNSSCPFCGTVYSISTSGKYKVIYAFGSAPDGEYPLSSLTYVKGSLYGTTMFGGSGGFGTVFSVTTSGTEKVLHSFASTPDGAGPMAGLIDVNGTLYGTTTTGGVSDCGEGHTGCGVIYSITMAGKEQVLHSFTAANDGASDPSVGLFELNGMMYGTAASDGNGSGCNDSGCGIIYSVSEKGHETALHVFNGGSDGAHPDGALIAIGSVLYGTTGNGGGSKCDGGGCGVVFALTPP